MRQADAYFNFLLLIHGWGTTSSVRYEETGPCSVGEPRIGPRKSASRQFSGSNQGQQRYQA